MASDLMAVDRCVEAARRGMHNHVWPQQADHPAMAERLRNQLARRHFTGVVVLSGPAGNAGSNVPVRGSEYVRHLVRITRELPEIIGESPRLYVVTRNAQTVLPDDRANLEQAGLRGLLRVIGAEHPHLRTTHIDVDEHTDVEQLARQLLLAGSEEDETAWRNDEWYTARLCPAPLRPEERHTTIVGPRTRRDAPADPHARRPANNGIRCLRPGPAGPRTDRGRGHRVQHQLRRRPARVRPVPELRRALPQLGTDFAGVVTAVGPDVTDHQVGDHVGGISPNGCWGTFVTCDARLATTLPPGLTDGQAAAVTTAHATAWYGLNDLARIRPVTRC